MTDLKEQIVSPEKILETCLELKKGGFDCLSCLTGTDKGDSIEVTYHLFSYETKNEAVLKTKLSRDDPKVDSVSNIWASAGWMEREAFDLLGIKFINHKNLKRILLPEDWEGFPLRKDYKEKDEYCGMGTAR